MCRAATVIVSLCLLLGVPAGSLSAPTASAIEGGETVWATDHPWVAHLHSSRGHCTGALIDPRWVLTAAHCIQPADPELLVVLGRTNTVEFGGELHRATATFTQDYPGGCAGPESDGFLSTDGALCENNDVALVQLTGYPSSITPVDIVTTPFFQGSLHYTFLGYGRTVSDPYSLDIGKLWRSDVQVSICQDDKQNLICYNKAGDDSQAGFRLCAGDSGGPLVDYDRSSGRPSIIGVAARPALPAQTSGCHNSAIFTRIFPKYSAWIRGVMAEHRVADPTVATTSCAASPPVERQAEVAAGAGSDRAAERGGGPLEMGLGARAAYLAVAPADGCNANNAFVHSYVAGVSRQGGRAYEARPEEWDAAVADGRVARAIAVLDQYLGGPGASGITATTVTRSGCASPPCEP